MEPIVRKFAAEVIGTFVFLVVALGSVAQFVLSESGSFFTVCFAFALGAAIAIFLVGEISGGHLNPAVSVALAVAGRFDFRLVPTYIVAQTIGAFLAAVVVFVVYATAIYDKEDELSLKTAGIFAPTPVMKRATFNSLLTKSLEHWF